MSKKKKDEEKDKAINDNKNLKEAEKKYDNVKNERLKKQEYSKELKKVEKQDDNKKQDDTKEQEHSKEFKELEKAEVKKIEEVKTNNNNGSDKINKKVKKKSIVKRIILILILVLILAGLIAFMIYSLPLKPEFDISKLTTKTGTIDEQIQLKCNQYIKKIYYSVNPNDENNLDEYTELELAKKGYKADIWLDKINLEVGEGKIYFVVQGMFTKSKPIYVRYKFDLGYVAEINENDLEKVNNSDDLYILKNQLLVTFKSNISENQIEKILKKYDGEIVGALYSMNKYQVKFENCSNMEELKEELLLDTSIEFVIDDYVWESENLYSTNDYIEKNNKGEEIDETWDESSPSGKNWHLECIKAPKAWELYDKEETSRIKVGVIDDLINYNNEDIKDNISKNHIFVVPGRATPSMDELWQEAVDKDWENRGHGTFCASIISAKKNNKKGIAGINDNTELYLATMNQFNRNKYGSKADCLTGTFSYEMSLTTLVCSGCRVINLSGGSEKLIYDEEFVKYYDEIVGEMENIYKKLEKKGYDFLVSQAAGNAGVLAKEFAWIYMIHNSEIMSRHNIIVGSIENVKSTTPKGGKPAYQYDVESSNFGDYVDICAPGDSIYGADPQSLNDISKYEYHGGTSVAAPSVAGVASMIYAINPNFTSKDVKDILVNNCTYRATVQSTNVATPILDAELAVSQAIYKKKNNEYQKYETPKYGYLVGTVKDSQNGLPLEDAEIVITNTDTGEVYNASTNSNGQYDLVLDVGTYNMAFSMNKQPITQEDVDDLNIRDLIDSKPNQNNTSVVAGRYVSEIIYKVKITEGVYTQNVTLKMVEDTDEVGMVSGKVVDAFDGNPIPNVKLKFRRGIENNTEESALEAVTDENGIYSIELEAGNWTACGSAEGYIDGIFYVISTGGTDSNQGGTLTPILKEGEIRAILTWGEKPSDLDSHLTGPTENEGNRFHVYYWNKNYYDTTTNTQMANLDVDDTSSYGPETISIYHSVDGIYNYSVYDYSNRTATDSNALGDSDAQVRLYVAGKDEPYVFNVPNKMGNCWKVFTVDKDGNVEIINEMTTTSDYEHIE